MRYLYHFLVLSLAALVFYLVIFASLQPAEAPAEPPKKYEVNSQPTLVFFTAEWCSPCKKLKQMMQTKSISQKLDVFNVIVVDIDKNPEVKRQFKVSHIPTLVKITSKDGKFSMDKQVGVPKVDFLERWLNEY